ncbi:MAG: hypothetical protein WC352_07685 [Candidatus Omnitrophota bacterium]|jgi:hypothetical protein
MPSSFKSMLPLCMILAGVAAWIPAASGFSAADTAKTAADTGTPETADDAKGGADLQMIASRMERLSGVLNRMPSLPKMDATMILDPNEEQMAWAQARRKKHESESHENPASEP